MNSFGRRIRVLVVDDSPVFRELLVHLLSSDDRLEVIGTAGDGITAIEQVRRGRPDVVTMDIQMPRMDGLEATRIIMETLPTPIVIISGSASEDVVAATFQSLEAGALAFLEKPHNYYGEAAAKLVEMVKLMAEVKLVRRWARYGSNGAAKIEPVVPMPRLSHIDLVVIGASTGGPQVLQAILSELPREFPAPLVIVQHISPGFVSGLVAWLEQSSGFRVQLAINGDSLRPAHCYVAPDGLQLGIEVQAGYLPRVRLWAAPAENGHLPSVSYMFRSATQALGPGLIGILLSGMGKDGAMELKRMKDTGAVTIAQNRETSVVAGMPGEAIDLGGATYVLPAGGIASMLSQLVMSRNN
jgi:two-component system chemotaxis response regulator CheB